jgi:hypothetical protein
MISLILLKNAGSVNSKKPAAKLEDLAQVFWEPALRSLLNRVFSQSPIWGLFRGILLITG